MKSACNIFMAIILFSTIVAFSPPIVRADIQVYDNNNEYLGILMYADEENFDIFIPSLSGIWKTSTDVSNWCGDELRPLYDSTNCSGTPYSNGPIPIIFDFDSISGDGFYKTDYSGKTTFTPGSYRDDGCICQQTSSYPQAEYYPFVQVQMPFTTPIAFPLRFEIETNTRSVLIGPVN